MPKQSNDPVSSRTKTGNLGPLSLNNGTKKHTGGNSTEQSINTLINQGSESQHDACGKTEMLSGIANDLILDKKKAPAVNEQKAKIVHVLLREKFTYGIATTRQKTVNV